MKYLCLSFLLERFDLPAHRLGQGANRPSQGGAPHLQNDLGSAYLPLIIQRQWEGHTFAEKKYNKDMNMQNWPHQHQVIKDLTAYLDEALPELTVDKTSGSVFTAAAALYRCNRYLCAIDDAVSSGTGDTAGGNLRTLYETWVLGHLLLLSSFDEARGTWGGTRYSAEKVVKAIGAEVQYPDDAPEATKDKNAEERAKALGKKLKTDDPENASMPTHCYDFIFRSESLLSSHANLTAIMQYARPVGETDGVIGLSGKNEGCEWRTLLAGYITSYFAQRLFKAASIDTTRLDEINEMLDPSLDDLQQVEEAK